MHYGEHFVTLQDIKMKKMADLQLKVVSDPKNKQAIEKQIAQWNENLEKLYIEQFRLRCYMASLQGSELPNPKVRTCHHSPYPLIRRYISLLPSSKVISCQLPIYPAQPLSSISDISLIRVNLIMYRYCDRTLCNYYVHICTTKSIAFF